MNLFDRMNLFGDICSNHRGDFDIAAKLILDIINVGAIPKIQLWSEKTWPREWSKRYGLLSTSFVPSIFRPSDLDHIMPYEPVALKIASVESTYWSLIKLCMDTQLPIMVSTGGMKEEELLQLSELFENYSHGLTVFHCVSIYPTPKEQINLGRLAQLSEDFSETDIIIGWSSHYPVVDHAAYALAWAWGATQFEVHVRPPYDHFEADLPGGKIKYVKEREPKTPDEQCAFTPYGLKQIRGILENLPVLEGSEDYIGPDREAVLEWRKRWQKPEQ